MEHAGQRKDRRKRIFPPKLRPGDEIRIVSPSSSLKVLSQEQKKIARQRLEAWGFRVSFGKRAEEIDEWNSSSVSSRVADLHEAFADPSVRGILTTLGGYNANQLLSYLDFELIRSHPKVFCGYSDITALSVAVYARTGLITYSGPHFSTFGMRKGFEYIADHFRKCVMEDGPIHIAPSPVWSDDAWYLDQENRTFLPNEGPFVVREGEAEGVILGGNLSTFHLLQGTPFMPDLRGAVLFLEDDREVHPQMFDRVLQSLLHLPDFGEIRGLVIGRFERASRLSTGTLARMLRAKEELCSIPVVINADFGHTSPFFTFPVGGTVRLAAREDAVEITILEH